MLCALAVPASLLSASMLRCGSSLASTARAGCCLRSGVVCGAGAMAAAALARRTSLVAAVPLSHTANTRSIVTPSKRVRALNIPLLHAWHGR